MFICLILVTLSPPHKSADLIWDIVQYIKFLKPNIIWSDIHVFHPSEGSYSLFGFCFSYLLSEFLFRYDFPKLGNVLERPEADARMTVMRVISAGHVFNDVSFESLVSDHLALNKFTRPSVAAVAPGTRRRASGCRNDNGILEVYPTWSHDPF